MILTGAEIKKRVQEGSIVITGYNEAHVGPNSYDVTLGQDLLMYVEPVLDVRRPNPTHKFTIPEQGYILRPNEVYIAHTNEHTESLGLVPVMHGKSSLGRLGLEAHICAGFGDVGFRGQWTLELRATRPVKIYPNMKIAQIAFLETTGEGTITYKGKYQDAVGSEASKSFKDFK